MAKVVVIKLPEVCGDPANKERCNQVAPTILLSDAAVCVADIMSGQIYGQGGRESARKDAFEGLEDLVSNLVRSGILQCQDARVAAECESH